MSEGHKHIVTEELLYRYFAGEAEAREAEQILTWKSESKENLMTHDQAYLLYLDMKAISKVDLPGKKYDTQAAWKKVKTQDEFSPSIAEQKPSSHLYLRIAASVLIVLGVGWFSFLSLSTTDELEVLASNEIVNQEMSDGSVVILNKESQLTFPETFDEKERKVKLEGEAYFSVAKDPDRPFVIRAGDIEVRVLGTTFNVNASAKSDSIVVSVDTGKVLISAFDNHEILEAGTTSVYYRSTRILVKIETETVGMHNYWRTKLLSFHGTQLGEVIEAIEKAYEVNIALGQDALADCRISVVFEGESLENILGVISSTLNLEVTNEGGKYLLTGDGCE